MKIETKYNIDDNVWILYNNRCLCCKVLTIKIDVNPKLYIQYIFALDKEVWLSEEFVFATKEELIKSL